MNVNDFREDNCELYSLNYSDKRIIFKVGGLGVKLWYEIHSKSGSKMHPIIQNNLTVIRELCVKHNVERLYLFGSALSDDFKPGESDIDFAAEYKKMTPGDCAKSYFGLLRGLKSLLNSEIDLIEMDAVKNKYFLEELLETRRILYDAA